MPYLIDSDWTIDHLTDEPGAQALLAQLAPEGLAISIVTYMEVYDGALRAADFQAAMGKLDAFLEEAAIAPLDEAVARQCAQLRIQLRGQKRRVHSRSLDLVIAATALTFGFTLVTRNVRDYADIPELQLYQF